MRLPAPLRILGCLAIATASCYLAFLAAIVLVLRSAELILATFGVVELESFRVVKFLPGLFTVTFFPSDGPPALRALYRGGFLLFGGAVLLFGPHAVRRAHGWLHLFGVQTILYAGSLVGLYSAFFVVWGRGPLGGLLRGLWPAETGMIAMRVLVGLGTAVLIIRAAHKVVGLLMEGAGEVRKTRLLFLIRWLLLPPVAFSLIITGSQIFRFRNVLITIFLYAPAFLVLAVGLPAVFAQPRRAVAFQVTARGASAVVCVLLLTLGTLLGYDHWNGVAQRARFQQTNSRHWQAYFPPAKLSGEQIAETTTRMDERLASLAARLTVKPPNPELRAFFHTSPETKRAVTGSEAPFTLLVDRNEVHHLLTPEGKTTDLRGDALLLMYRVWGKPGSAAVADALARYAVGQFQGYPLEEYAARITREEGFYTLRSILQIETRYLSPLARDALGGAWVDFLIQQKTKKLLRPLYQEPFEEGAEEKFARALNSSWEALERDWRSYILALADRRTPPSPRTRPKPFFHRGISFSHEVGRNWGYGSDRALEQLERIQRLGANAIAIVPYAFSRAPRETTIYFSTDESDDRVIRTIEGAQQLGLHVMLKPQIWGPGYTGDISFADDANFGEWFALYRRWLLHLARLAQLYRVELLVVGTELEGVTKYEEEWRALIRDVRRIYSGPLTYAAHWGESFENLPFWDALDYMGLNMYYPLASPDGAPSADSSRMEELVAKFEALALKHDKPVLFTEVGFPAVRTAAAEPWRESRAPSDRELQQRCYDAIFRSFYHQPWFAGLYWWKWPSHGRSGPDNSFNPVGKPAEKVITHWYGQPQTR